MDELNAFHATNRPEDAHNPLEGDRQSPDKLNGNNGLGLNVVHHMAGKACWKLRGGTRGETVASPRK